MSPFREIAVLPLQSQNRQPAYRARKRHSTARLRTDARPPRDGSEQFGAGTQAYGQIWAGRVELGPDDERFRSPNTHFEWGGIRIQTL